MEELFIAICTQTKLNYSTVLLKKNEAEDCGGAVYDNSGNMYISNCTYEKVSVIKKLINDMTISKIAQIVELSEEDVNNLIQKHNIKKY